MGVTAAQSIARPSTAPKEKRPPDLSHWSLVSLQIFLAVSVAAALWQMLGTEPQTLWECRVKWGLPGLAYLITVALWFKSSHQSRLIKPLVMFGSLLVMLMFGLMIENDFVASDHVLVPARLKEGRIVHDSLGLSYAMFPQFRVNPQPIVTRSSEAAGDKRQIQSARLGYGDLAVLIRIVINSSTPGAGGSPSTIILEVQRDSLQDLNALVLGVRRNEARWKEVPHVRIVQSTHRISRAGLDMVEFDFVEEPQNLVSRQVFLRSGSFILNFMLNVVNAGGLGLFFV